MWNTYAFTRSGYGIRPLATLSTATGNEIFGSVLISPALLTPPNKQTNKIIPSSRDLSGLATVGPHYTNCINEHCPLVNSSVNCQVYSRESQQLFCMYGVSTEVSAANFVAVDKKWRIVQDKCVEPIFAEYSFLCIYILYLLPNTRSLKSLVWE
jgi:hypothetical protein